MLGRRQLGNQPASLCLLGVDLLTQRICASTLRVPRLFRLVPALLGTIGARASRFCGLYCRMRLVELVLHCVQALAQGISVGTLAVPALLCAVSPGPSTVGTIPLGSRGLFRLVHTAVRLLELLAKPGNGGCIRLRSLPQGRNRGFQGADCTGHICRHVGGYIGGYVGRHVPLPALSFGSLQWDIDADNLMVVRLPAPFQPGCKTTG